MSPHKYTPEELLQLKEQLIAQNSVLELTFKSDVGNLLKQSNGHPINRLRRMKKPQEDISSSTESDDLVVFKGKKQSQVDESVDTKWVYRGRTESEATSEEPRSAPMGIAAQQSEGFQRFFKAVVSPTHVRVTAGGRIVPNTRASASPTPKWEKGRSAPEIQETTDLASQGKPEAMRIPNGQVMTPPVMSPFYPGHPTFFQHMGVPMPLYHVHPGLAWPYSVPSPQPESASSSQSAPVQDQAVPHPGLTVNQLGETAEKHRPAPIKISPPEQFEQNRPFFYNGHVVYPASSSGHLQHPMSAYMPSPYFPPGLVGTPGLPLHRAASMNSGPMSSVPRPSPMPPTAGASAHHTPPPRAPGSTIASSQAEGGHQQKPSQPVLPPVTSIKPSTITKRQLDSLRTSLRFFEDQLMFNKHQVDEQAMLSHRDTIKKQIEQFEHNYKMQLQFETSYYPKHNQSVKINGQSMDQASQSPGRTSSIKEARREDVAQPGYAKGANNVIPLRQAHTADALRGRNLRERNRAAVGINSSKSSGNSSAALDALEAHLLRQRDQAEHSGKSNLSTAAALAAPFHPGLAEPMSTTSEPQAGNSGRYDFDSAQDEDWSGPVTANPRLMSGGFAQDIGAVPYLVGKLPNGMSPDTARSAGYSYSRELTGEELRARHAYWGQVQTKGTGLPKFDGKDFYPPSPVKTSDTLSNTMPSRVVSAVQTDADHGFKLTTSGFDPFQSLREGSSATSTDTGRRLSKAIPIIAPDTSDSQSGNKLNVSSSKVTEPTKAGLESTHGGKPNLSTPGNQDRSSTMSGHDLWNAMLKKGTASRTALPSAFSSTTATGYLPQYFGHAAASLSPAFSNTSGSPARASTDGSNKPVELETGGAPLAAEKTGENCPPREATVSESEVMDDLHERIVPETDRRAFAASAEWQ